MSLVIDATHDPERMSWVEGADSHAEFPVQNLPLGIFAPPGSTPRVGSAIGDYIIDLAGIAAHVPAAVADCLSDASLNRLLALSGSDRVTLRRILSDLLSKASHKASIAPLLYEASDCTVFLPFAIGDYTDFYTGIHHATHVGRLFRPDNPLLPNYKYVPIGYHGRASSIRLSGVPVVRPCGQLKLADADAPSFEPCRRLDYELELGVWIGVGNALGKPIPIAQAAEHIAGLCLLNDWSARDIQTWEYQPLGPFLAKNFHSTISPWVVTAEALAPFRIAQPARPQGDPKPLPYLLDATDQHSGAFSIELIVSLSTERMRAHGVAPLELSKGPASNMYWTAAQMIAHHSSNGCNLNAGDLLGTGTISAPTADGFGSLLEITRGGAEPVSLPTGETRRFLEDGDEISLHGRLHAGGFVSIGFGPCRAIVASAPRCA